jgi:hypothetical protein
MKGGQIVGTPKFVVMRLKCGFLEDTQGLQTVSEVVLRVLGQSPALGVS